MADTQTIAMQDNGVVKVDDGNTVITLVNLVDTVEIDFGGSYERSDRTVAGESEASSERGIDPEVPTTVTLNCLQEAGAAVDHDNIQKGGSHGKDVTVEIFPEGDTTGNRTISFPGMHLENRNEQGPFGKERPPYRLRFTFEETYKWSAVPQWTTVP